MRSVAKWLLLGWVALAISPSLWSQAGGAEGGRGQAGRGPQLPPNMFAAGVPKMTNPPGPAPKHDLNGAWIGPLMSARVEWPPLTPAGQAAMKENHPESAVTLAATNDPFATCDPLGLSRGIAAHALINKEGVWFHEASGQMVLLQQYQRVWRNVWTDGRPLPTNIAKRGGPDATFYGTSVGHWDGDTTFVIDTTGVDDRTWLDENGHPHTTDAHYQERYTRVDQYTIQMTMTIDDPKYYTKPIEFLKSTYYWMKDQDFPEAICVPSEAIAYRESLAKPAGTGGKQ